ncbi:hypothetical protein IJ117_00820 [Candidatus Saccharibacteria bacterium]|nr:hypothetical protein [Candidatus Saccharibacteria bacterium]
MIKWARIVIASMLVAVLGVVGNVGRVWALTPPVDATDKFLHAIVQQCYIDNQFERNVSIGSGHVEEKNIISGKKTYLLPDGNSTGYSSMNCREVFFGKGDFPGVLQQNGAGVNFNNASSIGSVLQNKLQYVADGGEVSQRCIYVQMTPVDFANNVRYNAVQSNKVCAEVEDDGDTIASNTFMMGDYGYSTADSGIHISNGKGSLYASFIYGDATDSGEVTVNFKKGDSLIDVANRLKSAINTHIDAIGSVCTAWQGFSVKCNNGFVFESGDNVFYDRDASEAVLKYKLDGDLAEDGVNASTDIFGSQNTNVLKANAIALYQEYLADAQSKGYIDITCPISDAVASGGGYTTFSMVYDGAKTKCGARNIISNDTTKYVGLQSNLTPKLDNKLSINDIISQLTGLVDGATDAQIQSAAAAITNVIKPDQIADSDTLPPSTVPGSENTDDGPGCLKSGAAGSLGWILCPALEMMSNLAEGIYDSTIKPNLQIEPELFTGDKGGTKQGWEVFQQIANTLLIVLFLVVIFSQLTGYGIDNYGIKRLLPKIILVAILMNLSFYICELAIDTSNIAGAGIQGIFDNLPTGLSSDATVPGTATQLVTGTLVSVAIAGSAWGVVAASGGLTVAFLTMLPTIVGVVISLFFLFVILAARQAAVVVFVVISPLAFACYLLPNTKRFFDKWLKVMEALLLVFPICSLLVAGGDYVSRLLLASGFASDDLVRALTAMLVGIAPIFFIPSILRNSMSGLGNLGSRISNLGSRLSNRASGGVRNNDAYRSALGAAQERRNVQLSGKRWNASLNDGRGGWENAPGRIAAIRRRINSSRLGRAAGWDRLEGRRSQKAEVDRSTAETERQNANLDVMNAQRAKNQAMYEDRSGDAGGYAEFESNLAPGEYAELLRGRRVKAQDDTVDRLSGEAGTAQRHVERYRTETLDERRTRSAGTQELARQREGNRLNEMEGQGLEALRTRAKEVNEANGNFDGDERTRGIRSITSTREFAEGQARAERMRRQATTDAGAPQLDGRTLATIAGNEVLMTNAQQAAGVAAINEQIARSRAEASRDAQEYKLAYDQYSSLAKAGRMETFGNMLDATNTGTGAGARARAAFDSLFKTGDVAEVLDVMSKANLSTMDKNVRDSLVQSAASSGNAFLKGWAKTSGAMTLADYIKSVSDDKNAGWNAYIEKSAGEHVLDNMDKDTLDFLWHNDAAQYLPSAAIKNALITAANQNQTSRNAVVNMAKQSGKLAEIGAEFSAADLTKLSLEGAEAIGPDNLQAAIEEINRPGNETLRANIKDGVKEVLGIVDDAVSNTPTPANSTVETTPASAPVSNPVGGNGRSATYTSNRATMRTMIPADVLRVAMQSGSGELAEAAADELASRASVPLTKDDLMGMSNDVVLRRLIASNKPAHINSIVAAARDLTPEEIAALPQDVRFAIDEARGMRGETGL